MSDPIPTAPEVATQVKHPWVATLRTFIQVGLPTLVGFALILPSIIDEVLKGYGETIPPELRGVLLAVAGFIVTTSLIITRLMANPKVNAFLAKLKLGAAGKHES